MALARNFLYYGKDEPLPERIPLRAGPLEALFDQGDLRAIRLAGREIVRRIYVAVRDRNWGTVPAQIVNVRMKIEEDAFTIEYDAAHRQDEVDFSWRGSLRGIADGRIAVSMDGVANATFWKNRIGFCVLFPASCAGQPVIIEHEGGGKERAAFPTDLSADQPVRPFENIRAITLLPVPGVEARVQFSGDVFEMEDQRLWTDASYKVFCTPLALPYPVEIQSGTRVIQKIELAASARPPGKISRAGSASARITEFRLPQDEDWGQLPLLGLGTASHGKRLSTGEIEQLRALHLSHLRVDLDLGDEHYPQRAALAIDEAAALGLGLEIALMVPAERAEDSLGELRERLESMNLPVCHWLITPAKEFFTGGSPTGLVLRAARQRLEDYRPGTPFAAGTNADFIFLKRTPPPLGLMDRVCIALNPQVHAFDPLSLVETLEAQPAVVESARRLAGGLPVVVSPITLRPRFNPYATGPQPGVEPGELPPQVDPRQRSLFGAGWTLGSLRAMVSAGVESATYYETTGWRGVIEREEGSPWPPGFPILPGVVFPLYHVLADAGEFAGGQAAALVLASETNAASARVSGLAVRLGNAVSILLANHTAEQQRIVITGVQGHCSARTLDETNAKQAMRFPFQYRLEGFTKLGAPELILLPFGCARIDLQ